MNRIKRMLAIAAAAGLLAACSAPGWLAGNDDGEAYEAYTEEMEKTGIPPEKW